MKSDHEQRREEMIDLMPADRRMDALIAERVMGFKVFYDPTREHYLCDDPEQVEIGGHVKMYSTAVAHIWQVVEKLNPKHPLILTFRPQEQDWWAMLPDESRHPKGQRAHGPNCFAQAFGNTAPLAICRAALKIVGRLRSLGDQWDVAGRANVTDSA